MSAQSPNLRPISSLGFSSSCYPSKYLRVPHPSRLVRRVGSYTLTPPIFFSSLLGFPVAQAFLPVLLGVLFL